MKPIIIVPPDVFSEEAIQQLRDNELCVVVATDPSAVRFMDPIPAATSRSKIEQAAIDLSRMILHGKHNCGSAVGRQDACKLFVECLVKGTPLDSQTEDEIDKRLYEQAKYDAFIRLAREEARAEREAKKAEKLKKAASGKS